MNMHTTPIADSDCFSLQDLLKRLYAQGWITVVYGAFGWQVVACTSAKDRVFKYLTHRADTDMDSRYEFLVSEIMGDFLKDHHYKIGALYKFMADPMNEAARDEWISCARHFAEEQMQTQCRYMMQLSGANDLEAAAHAREQKDFTESLER
jgi:hypothetical protein